MRQRRNRVKRRWPQTLWLVRHGESAGNVALRNAELAGSNTIDIDARDVDVPLSPLGERQATALGRWFRTAPPEHSPTVVLSSPYERAVETARRVAEAGWGARAGVTHAIDERLREREFGALDRLTKVGIVGQFPAEVATRARLGKFYYRPPGGESWCDVVLRLRNVLHTFQLEYPGERVLVVAHQVVVMCFRYLLEQLTEKQILELDRVTQIANCSVTTYELDDALGKRGALRLRDFDRVTPLDDDDAPVTAEPDHPKGTA